MALNKKHLTQLGGIHGFKINTVGLLKEIADAGLDRKMGVLKVPLNVLLKYLKSVAERSAQLNDPILNKIMCDMALYEVANPESKDFDPEILKIVKNAAIKQQQKEKKK